MRIPEAISGCWNLQSLHLIRCKGLVELPESIGKLKKLRTLGLNFASELESLPQSIGDCQDLQSLNLYFCKKFREIPSTICEISNLRVLRIYGDSSLKQLPSECTREFSNLRTLDLYETEVTVLPHWVTAIGTLECINLQGCYKLLELPKGIGNLKRLIVLNIEGCISLCCIPSGIGQLTSLRQLGLFVVGCGRDARISELGNLDRLSGKLEIRNLKYLKDLCDAKKACLKQKNGIRNLVLNWSLNKREELASNVEQEQALLNYLEPPLQIMYLKIKGFRGPCLPRWLMEQNCSSYYEGTTVKNISPCQYLSITNMTLSQFPNLKHIQGLLMFPSLKSLELWEMASLEELWTTTSGFEIQDEELSAQCCFPVLSNLSIRDCPQLSSVKPYFPPLLENLFLRETNLHLLSPGSFSHMLPPPANESSSSSSLHSVVPHLKQLQLHVMRGSSSVWELLQYHTYLETLCINDCNDLTQVPESIRSLTSLQRLEITQ